MRSDRHGVFCLLAFILVGAGCTEELPIEPVTTSADDWTPTFSVRAFGYQRVAVEIDGPPRKELVPNIARYILSIREESDTVDIPIDTVSYVHPSYVEAAGLFARLSWTDARIPVRTSFLTKLSVEYRNGVVRSTLGVPLPADPARGTILRRYDISSVTGGTQWWEGKIALWRSRPLFNSGERLYVVDTVRGSPQYLGDLVMAGSSSDARLLCFGVDGDTLVAGILQTSPAVLRLLKLNLNTLAVDSSKSIALNATEYCTDAAGSNGKVALVLLLNDGRVQLKTYDTRTGLLVQAYPPGPFLNGLSYDGTDFWVAQYADPFNAPMPYFDPIQRLDPTTMAFTIVHRNPVDHYKTCIVGASTAWIVDEMGPRTIVEARLEGF